VIRGDGEWVVELLGLWPIRLFQTRLFSRFGVAGKRTVARRSTGSRAKFLSGLRKITAEPRDSPLWVTLESKVGRVPALIETGAQFSCVRSDVAEYFYLREEPCVLTSCSVTCSLTDGQRCEVTDVVSLHVKLLSFSWDHEFIVLRGGTLSGHFGVTFLRPH
jgi:hypothetical protein